MATNGKDAAPNTAPVLRAERVRHGGEDDRNVLRCRNNGLCGRRGDGNDHGRVFADELAGNLRGRRGVALRRLVDELQVLAFLVAGGFQRFLDAVTGGIEGGMFDDGRHRDGDVFGLCRQRKRDGGRESEQKLTHG